MSEIVIVGLGLIGGSVARGLRSAGYGGRIVGVVENRQDAQKARELDIVDDCYEKIYEAVSLAGLVVVAVPPDAIPEVFSELSGLLRPGAVVTDTASSKSGVVAAARAAFDAESMRFFVPGHPIAGTEHNGLDAGFADLFREHRVILTPNDATNDSALARVESLWTLLGAQVVRMNAEHHDEVLAATSHLPHVLAYALVDMLAGQAERTEIFAFAAGGFSDFTRIASSNPALWRSIISANRKSVLQMVREFENHLMMIRKVIENNEYEKLESIFSRAKSARDDFVVGGLRSGHGEE